MAFTIDRKDIDRLSNRLKVATDVIKKQVGDIISTSVLSIENNARARAPLGKTYRLKGSIYSTPYNANVGATVGARVFYSPFVEFGTGPGPGNSFQIPVYRNLNMNSLEAYAQTFKRNNGNVVNLPHRPFLFNSASEELYKMVNSIKKIKI
jgi:phage gpG-like protein